MADAKNVLSVIGTVKSRLPDLSIKNGQLIFVQDGNTIALDFNGKRKFYNEIIQIDTEEQREEILAPIQGAFYFVVNTAILWTYQSDWIQITTQPKDVVFIGVELPLLGSEKTLYVNSTNKNISIWNSIKQEYEIVADKTTEITREEITSLFI